MLFITKVEKNSTFSPFCPAGSDFLPFHKNIHAKKKKKTRCVVPLLFSREGAETNRRKTPLCPSKRRTHGRKS